MWAAHFLIILCLVFFNSVYSRASFCFILTILTSVNPLPVHCSNSHSPGSPTILEIISSWSSVGGCVCLWDKHSFGPLGTVANSCSGEVGRPSAADIFILVAQWVLSVELQDRWTLFLSLQHPLSQIVDPVFGKVLHSFTVWWCPIFLFFLEF